MSCLSWCNMYEWDTNSKMYTQTKERLQSHSPAGTMLYDAAVYATAAEVHCGLMKTLEPAENDFVANDAEKSGKAAPYSPMYKRNHCSTPRKASQHNTAQHRRFPSCMPTMRCIHMERRACRCQGCDRRQREAYQALPLWGSLADEP